MLKRTLQGKAGFSWMLVLLALASLWPLGSLGRFMLDGSAKEHARSPHLRAMDLEPLERPFFPEHNCFSSYMVAVELAEQGVPNLYAPEHYRNPEVETPVHREIDGHLKVDRYQYPPPFLVLPWLLKLVGGGFWGARAWFYGLNLVAFGLCLWSLQRWVPRSEGGQGGSPLLWGAWPLVLLASNALTTLQIGNVHAFVMVLSVLGVLAAERGRDALSGALLGFVCFGKIFPGILLVFLLGQGKRRAVLWSLGFGLLYTLLTFVLFGSEPLQAFFGEQLARLSSGEAFDFAFRDPRAMLLNSSFVGIAFRLQMLGLLESAKPLVPWISSISALVILVLAWLAGRACGGRGADSTPGGTESKGAGPSRYARVAVWLALLYLAQMRSPFLPWGYGAFVGLWLLATWFLAPQRSMGWRLRLGLLLPAWCLLGTSLPLPMGGTGLTLDLLFALSAIAVGFGLVAWSLMGVFRARSGSTV